MIKEEEVPPGARPLRQKISGYLIPRIFFGLRGVVFGLLGDFSGQLIEGFQLHDLGIPQGFFLDPQHKLPQSPRPEPHFFNAKSRQQPRQKIDMDLYIGKALFRPLSGVIQLLGLPLKVRQLGIKGQKFPDRTPLDDLPVF